MFKVPCLRWGGLHPRLGRCSRSMTREIHRRGTYYDMLGVTPHATQADIKKAFYKLSMQFHPDKATGNDAKFREISTAYEVLGNLKLRKMYDKGLLPAGASASMHENIRKRAEEEVTQFRGKWSDYTEHAGKKRAEATGRTSAYDYDEWVRRHYSDVFTKDQAINNRAEWMRRRRREVEEERKKKVSQHERFVALFLGTIIVFSLIDELSLRSYDAPKRSKTS